MMEEIQSGDSVVQATVIYPSTQAADGVKLARLIAQNKTVGDLASIGVPRTVQLFAPVVTADNVEEYLPIGFDS
jgi:ribose transport system substrate-binding protein